MQRALDDMFKASGHVNAYFPLFIPQSFIAKEAKHVEGFAPELAIVTHGGGKELEEPLVVRPTSETIIYHMYAKWVQSYRDLPILINQWANVVRWEMRTRLFLRTLEFLWQEGHTAHATHDEAEAETLTILGIYRRFAEEWMAMPVLTGLKSDSERFAGALRTYCIEAMMQDRKALQAGTSHNLGQNFSKVFDLKFQSEAGTEEFAWNTSWGVSTRMVGGLVMTHGDDNGIVTPPRLAPIEVVIVPIWKTNDERPAMVEAAMKLKAELTGFTGRGESDRLRVHVDAREGIRSGAKYYEWEMRGVPLRLELGPKDLEKQSVFSARRDTRAKAPIPRAGAPAAVAELLKTIQADMFAAAKARREAATIRGVTEYGQFKEIMAGDGGFVYAGWNGDPAVEARVKEETKATIRVIPDAEFRSATAPTKCMVTGEPAKYEVVWAKAY
jgi:prolyl-tRNA synthetase